MGNGFFTVCGIVEIDGKILFVRHTYGSAKNRILCPGGYVEENEGAVNAIEREILEETGITAKVTKLLAMQFKKDQWCAVFLLEYISGVPRSDNFENNEILLLDAKEAFQREDITNMSRELIKMYIENRGSGLEKRDYMPRSTCSDDYALFG